MTTHVVLSLTQAVTCPWNFCLNSLKSAFHLCIVSLQNSLGIKAIARLNRTWFFAWSLDLFEDWDFVYLEFSFPMIVNDWDWRPRILLPHTDGWLLCVLLHCSASVTTGRYMSVIYLPLLHTTGHFSNWLARVNEQLTAENWHNMHQLSNPSRYLANIF